MPFVVEDEIEDATVLQIDKSDGLGIEDFLVQAIEDRVLNIYSMIETKSPIQSGQMHRPALRRRPAW